MGKKFLVCVAKTSPSIYVVCAFRTSQIMLLSNHQYLYGILNIVWMKTLLWYALFSFPKRSVFTFIIIKPKTKLCFTFSNIGSIITNFTSQKVKNLFWVTVKGPFWILNTSRHAFVVKALFVIIWSHTWQVPFPHSSEPPALSIFGYVALTR